MDLISRISRNRNKLYGWTATTATIIVKDNANHQQNSTPITVSVINTNVNIGTVQACGINITEFLNYSLDGVTYNSDSSNNLYIQIINNIMLNNK